MNKYLLATAVVVIVAAGGIVYYQDRQKNSHDAVATAPSPSTSSVQASPSASPTTNSAKVDQAVNGILKESTYGLVMPEESDPSLQTPDVQSFGTSDQAFNVSSNEL